ncbi:MAG: metalloregulator ArsR/SmtB family transcription factor [Bacteroidales bacterium]|jgi:DNA-binding transcriptional ArsR family regulator|nr:metalloregulator ArsR/SmtB family transcription factor [Bacteroidales bacterium]NCU36848.1 transcriptional regulator [Candidatus Falkowbacteria bacterium]MDD2633432.1 metalloregulator ArsR/SmtB family transcription factor [Bacteroidales bacterium]MDD3132604.1 metalloregulator ArsR/SmtB family transcription factor [Bacteroidales bacterium]MDD4177826.1 metalloregulator ArsR/SmtB family transcription factor [Bacteroidales bacterium]
MDKKTKIDPEKLEAAASRLRAIGHPMRIAIIELLEQRPLNVTEIYTKLEIEQAAASHHLNILKNKNMLVSRRRGRQIFYSIRNHALTDLIDCINRCNE